jgi:hypothetical protein
VSDAKLGILLTADDGQFTKTLGDLQAQLKRFQDALKDTTSVDSFNRINRAIDVTKSKIAAFNSIRDPLKSLTSSTGQATVAMVNLGRVLQDAPFGFIGIANNLNPLLESFQRLKLETGSTGGAIKALTSSLAGGGGLGLALSAVTAIMSFASLGASAWTRGMSGATSEAEKHTEVIQVVQSDYDRLAESIVTISSSLAQEATSFNLLLPSLSDYSLSNKERARVLEELQSKYPAYLDNLKKETQYLKDAGSAIVDNIKFLAIQTEVKALMGAMNSDFEKAIRLQVELNDLRRNQAQGEGGFFAQSESDFKAEEQRLQTELRGLTNSLKAGKNSLEIVAGGGKSLLETLFPDIDKTDKVKSKVEDIVAKAKRIFEETKDIITLKLTIRADDSDAEQKKKAQEYLNDYFKGNYKIKVKTELVFTAPAADAGKQAGLEFSQMFFQEINEQKAKVGTTDFTLVDAQKLEAQKKLLGSLFGVGNKNSLLSSAQQDAVATAQILNDILSPAFTGLFDKVEKGENIFKAFFEGIASSFKQLAEKLIANAVLAGILSALFPGGIGGVSGFGGIFKNLLGFRAEGGPVSAGRPYIVGERGPELVIPSSSGMVIPNGNMSGLSSGFSGGSSVQVVPLFRNGQLDLLIKQTNKFLRSSV